MARKNDREVASCYECAGLQACYKTKTPDLTRSLGREKAKRCHSLRKGLTTQTVKIDGAEKGMSRKKAEKLVNKDRGEWILPGVVRIFSK